MSKTWPSCLLLGFVSNSGRTQKKTNGFQSSWKKLLLHRTIAQDKPGPGLSGGHEACVSAQGMGRRLQGDTGDGKPCRAKSINGHRGTGVRGVTRS